MPTQEITTDAGQVGRVGAASQQRGAPDDGRYVDTALLLGLEEFVQNMRERDGAGACAPEQTRRVEQFLYSEARLLDARNYRAWFDLLSEDFAYWIPSDPRQPGLRSQVAVNFDDRRRMLDRIAFTESGVQVAQTPPSRTVRTISNVQAWNGPGAAIEATQSLVIWSHRRGQTRYFVGRAHHLLAPSADSFAIRAKVIELLDCDEPQGNNSFIL